MYVYVLGVGVEGGVDRLSESMCDILNDSESM